MWEICGNATRGNMLHCNMWECAIDNRDIHACTLKNAKICVRATRPRGGGFSRLSYRASPGPLLAAVRSLCSCLLPAPQVLLHYCITASVLVLCIETALWSLSWARNPALRRAGALLVLPAALLALISTMDAVGWRLWLLLLNLSIPELTRLPHSVFASTISVSVVNALAGGAPLS